MSEIKKNRIVRMSDDAYNRCQRVAGNRSFSPWAEHALMQACGEIPTEPGRIPGGLCECGKGGAWVYMKSWRVYWCSDCAQERVKRSPDQVRLYEDRKPKYTPSQYREMLVKALTVAAAELVAYDSAHPDASPLEFDGGSSTTGASKAPNLPADIRKAVATSPLDDEDSAFKIPDDMPPFFEKPPYIR